MPTFKIIPLDHEHKGTEFTGIDAGATLGLVEHLGYKEADVLKNDSYVFSVYLNPNGLWQIYQRPEASAGTFSSFG